MTLTVTVALGSTVPPRVLLDVASSPSVSDEVRVYRVHEDGSQHRVLTDGRALIVGSWSGYDYHAPFNQPFRYFAEADGQQSAVSASLFVPSDRMWLMHPADPALAVMPAQVITVGPRKLAGSAAAYKVLGRSVPVVRTDFPRGPEAGDITVMVDDNSGVLALEALLADGGPVLINSARSDVLRWMWVLPGDVTVESPISSYSVPNRLVSFPFTACAAPDADVEPDWTFADVKATFATFAAVSAAYPNFRSMKLDIRNP